MTGENYVKKHQVKKICKGTFFRELTRSSHALVFPRRLLERREVPKRRAIEDQDPRDFIVQVVDACAHRAGEPRCGDPQADATEGLARPSAARAPRRPGARIRPCVRAPARARARGLRAALGGQWGWVPRAGGGAMTRAPRDPALGLRPKKPEAAAVAGTGWAWRGGRECFGVCEPRDGSRRDSRAAEAVAIAAAAAGAAAVVGAGSGQASLGQQPPQGPLRLPVRAAVTGGGGLVSDSAAAGKAGATLATPGPAGSGSRVPGAVAGLRQ